MDYFVLFDLYILVKFIYQKRVNDPGSCKNSFNKKKVIPKKSKIGKHVEIEIDELKQIKTFLKQILFQKIMSEPEMSQGEQCPMCGQKTLMLMEQRNGGAVLW